MLENQANLDSLSFIISINWHMFIVAHYLNFNHLRTMEQAINMTLAFYLSPY